VKNIYPLTVVIEIELSKKMALVLFYIFLISSLGISMKVSPKNTFLGLNFEKKHKRLFVMYIRPERMILSANPQT